MGLGHKLCDKEDNYTFSMRITTNEKYSCWALLGIQTFWTCSKLSYWPAEATRTRRTLFELIVIVTVIAGMTKNDQGWSLEQTRIVNSSSFGSRFGAVALGHYVHWEHIVIVFVAQVTCCILVILTVYYVIHACNISDERSAYVTR